MNNLALKAWNLLHDLPPVRLADATTNLCSGAGVDCSTKAKATNPLTSHVQAITDTLLTVAGAVAVVIIIVGGITYITSSGDAARVKVAKDTILYAVVGLVVVILAYAIVNFVAGNI